MIEVSGTVRIAARNNPSVQFTVDAADLPIVIRHAWHATRQPWGGWYAKARISIGGKSTTIYMHRLIMGAQRGQVVDHADRDSTNNRRNNLRFCTYSQSNCNRIMKRGSGFRGVWPVGNRWRAELQARGKRYRLGYFGSAIEAARAYDALAIDLHGEFAVTNADLFPGLLASD